MHVCVCSLPFLSNIKSLCAYNVMWLNHRAGPGKGQHRENQGHNHPEPALKEPQIEPGLSPTTHGQPACVLQSFTCTAAGQSGAAPISQPLLPSLTTGQGLKLLGTCAL